LGQSAKYLDRTKTPYLSTNVPTVPAGSVLIAKRGGAIALDRVRLLAEPGFMDTNVMALTTLTELDSEYLFYWLSQRGLWDIADVTSVPQINNKHINPLLIELPEIDEQFAIVKTLRDADSSIGSLARQIAKQRDIKQGMMQELLTGRTRLHGFIGAWTATRLSTVLRFQPGFPFSSQYFTDKPDGPRLVRNRDLRAEDTVVYYTGPVPGDFILARGDVLVGMDGDFEPKLWFEPGALLNQRVGRLLLTTSIDGAFLAHALVGPLKVLQGETGATTVKHLSHSDVEQLELLLPSVAEQRAIARALDDADRLIASLKRRLESAHAIKQGMMQELLSGRTRLPVKELAA
jgi:type I restriction enzyme S subunit